MVIVSPIHVHRTLYIGGITTEEGKSEVLMLDNALLLSLKVLVEHNSCQVPTGCKQCQ